jgi:hypothetical protein
MTTKANPTPAAADVAEELNDNNLVAASFLVINPKAGAFGLGAELNEALKNCRKESGPRYKGKQTYTVLAFTCERAKVKVYASVDLRWTYPEGHRSMRFTFTA